MNTSNNLNAYVKDIQTRELKILMDGIENKILDDRIHLNDQDQLVLGNQGNSDAVRELCSDDQELILLVKEMIAAIPSRMTEVGLGKIKSNALLFVTDQKWLELGVDNELCCRVD